MSNKQKREYQIVVWGASSVVGRQVAFYLAKHHSDLRWTIAGRSKQKLQKVVSELAAIHEPLSKIQPLYGDSDDRASLDKITSQTDVVISTVGPYALYGDHLVASCVHNATHYCDITGETWWVKKIIDSYHRQCEEKKTLVIHFCGLDSVPGDVGAKMMARHCETEGFTCEEVRGYFVDGKGDLASGTVLSLMGAYEQGKVGELLKPHLLCPPHCRKTGPKDGFLPAWDRSAKMWTAPYIMAPINTRAVRRTAAILGKEANFSEDFTYTEFFGTKWFAVAAAVSVVTLFTCLFLALPPARWLVKKFVLPRLQGPTQESIDNGFWDVKLLAKGKKKDGNSAVFYGTVRGNKDPGYGDTSAMLSEIAVYVARNREKCAKGGVLTPGVAVGEDIIDELRKTANICFDVTKTRWTK
ncbi:saccharopine dehydrogenase [Planoprotostelium fungivorum]|uniref:Saccharopine dehydrogenase n=1 Tax=Planoprotostelium fungivorum TaxID=1890364 RepID=A0A2P6NDL3_9EUKA|nr:saccharopine dehydrogenase [Planoprotostelium fungivorum]